MSRIRRSLTAIAVPATLAFGLMAGMGAGPARAAGVIQQAGKSNPLKTTGGGSSNGGNYVATVSENLALSGDYTSGYNQAYAPPECWLQPEFMQPQTYRAGDPSGSQTDADSYWFWFGDHFPGFARVIRGTNSLPLINQTFQQEQKKQRPAGWTGPNPIQADDVWWVPNWLGSTAGWSCAQNLVYSNNLSDVFLGLEPPAQPGSGGGSGQVTSLDLAELARAAIRLPLVRIVTSPSASTVVNLPTYVSVDYQGKVNPSDEAAILVAGAPYLWAKVHATLSNVQITSDAPSSAYQVTGAGRQGQACAAVNGKATSACGITFSAPSGATPYTITVSVTWTVSWSTSAGNGGTFASTPPSTRTRTIVVREIQTQT